MASEITEYSARLIRAVKAELARRDVPGSALIPVLGISKNSLYSRLRFERSFETDELAKIVDYLDMDMDALFASAALDSKPKVLAA